MSNLSCYEPYSDLPHRSHNVCYCIIFAVRAIGFLGIVCDTISRIVDRIGSSRKRVEDAELELMLTLDAVRVDFDKMVPVTSGVVMPCS